MEFDVANVEYFMFPSCSNLVYTLAQKIGIPGFCIFDVNNFKLRFKVPLKSLSIFYPAGTYVKGKHFRLPNNFD